MTDLTAIIPARGGSKRLPGKNILPLQGKPLLAITLDNIKRSGVFSRIVVSSEDTAIQTVARDIGVEILERPLELAGDEVGVDQVCHHAITTLKLDPDSWFCCVYATAVLLKSDSLRKAWQSVQSSLKDDHQSVSSAMGVSRYNYHPAQALIKNQEGYLDYLLPEFKGKQSQAYPETWVCNGTYCWSSVQSFLKYQTFYTPKLLGIDVPESEVCDIDYPEDFERLLEKISSHD